MNKKILIALLSLSVIVSLFFNLYKKDISPPCINSDEAAHGYTAYSLLKTGRDEYGAILPLRFKSFGEYKMPVYSYLSVPIIAASGLNDFSVRFLNTIVAALFPLAVFFLSRELFKKDSVGVLASFLVSASLGLAIAGRHAHEAYLAYFFVTVATYYFLRLLKNTSLKNSLLFLLNILLALFSYFAVGAFALFFLLFAAGYFYFNKPFNKEKKLFIFFFILSIVFFVSTNIIYKPSRVQSLFLTNDPGFSMSIGELTAEGGPRVLYNKVTMAVKELINNEVHYFSPQFLVLNGDENKRFGFPSMSPMTIIEYFAIFVGIYYLFRNKEKWRYFILLLFVVAPIPSALTWAEASLTRTLFLLIPAYITAAYGIYNLYLVYRKTRFFRLFLSLIIFIEAIGLFYSWDFYLNHYPQRGLVIRSWSCGNKEMAEYVKNNYDKFDTFYITKKNGQPYIFLLFYLNYPPSKYHQEANLTAPDKFGFGQVENFDKFNFNFIDKAEEKNVVLIGYPDDYNDKNIDMSKIKKITVGREEIFWIYEK